MLPPSSTSTTRSQVQSALFGMPLSLLVGRGIVVCCGDPTCPPERVLLVGEVLRARGDMRLADFARRLRCSGCQGAPHWIRLREHRPEGGYVDQPVYSAEPPKPRR